VNHQRPGQRLAFPTVHRYPSPTCLIAPIKANRTNEAAACSGVTSHFSAISSGRKTFSGHRHMYQRMCRSRAAFSFSRSRSRAALSPAASTFVARRSARQSLRIVHNSPAAAMTIPVAHSSSFMFSGVMTRALLVDMLEEFDNQNHSDANNDGTCTKHVDHINRLTLHASNRALAESGSQEAAAAGERMNQLGFVQREPVLVFEASSFAVASAMRRTLASRANRICPWINSITLSAPRTMAVTATPSPNLNAIPLSANETRYQAMQSESRICDSIPSNRALRESRSQEAAASATLRWQDLQTTAPVRTGSEQCGHSKNGDSSGSSGVAYFRCRTIPRTSPMKNQTIPTVPQSMTARNYSPRDTVESRGKCI
jgi:hypothetical protein